MVFSECIELARQRIAARDGEHEYTIGDERPAVCRWKGDDDFGGPFVYVGDTLRDVSPYSDSDASDAEDRSNRRIGCGTCIWESAGAQYDGWWWNARHGWGLMMYQDGTVIEGLWKDGDLSETSAIMWLRDGSRCIVGSWKSTGIPIRGAMMEANGDVYYFKNNNLVLLFYMETATSYLPRLNRPGRERSIDGETAWAMAVRAMTDEDSPLYSGLERQLVGRVVVGGAPMPGGAGVVRAVHIELADGGTYVGPMRGLSYWSVGVMTDALGGAWRLDSGAKYSKSEEEDYDQRTFAEPDLIIGREAKKVLETVLFSVHGFPSSNSESLSFIRAAAEAGGACGARRCAGRARRVDGGDIPVCRKAIESVTFASRP